MLSPTRPPRWAARREAPFCLFLWCLVFFSGFLELATHQVLQQQRQPHSAIGHKYTGLHYRLLLPTAIALFLVSQWVAGPPRSACAASSCNATRHFSSHRVRAEKSVWGPATDWIPSGDDNGAARSTWFVTPLWFFFLGLALSPSSFFLGRVHRFFLFIPVVLPTVVPFSFLFVLLFFVSFFSSRRSSIGSTGWQIETFSVRILRLFSSSFFSVLRVSLARSGAVIPSSDLSWSFYVGVVFLLRLRFRAPHPEEFVMDSLPMPSIELGYLFLWTLPLKKSSFPSRVHR